MKKRLLIVEDEKNTREGLRKALEDLFDVYVACDADEAFRLMDELTFDVVLTDLKMAGKSGLFVVDNCLKKPYKPICIMMTAYGSVEMAVEAMKHGAFDFLPKPVNLKKLELLIQRALQERELKEENSLLHDRLDTKYGFEGLIGQSKAFKKVLEQVKQIAPTKATVLITGPTGTGKELIAQMLHQHSLRAKKKFVAVHCAALPSNLLESELFGHEKGSFTGAAERRIGRFELAHEGTLFLDEIGEIDASIQVKLLRFLENKTLERVGGNIPIAVDTRLICATNRNLSRMVEEGKFREDLLYRLNVIHIDIPPLKERTDDLPLLLNYYLKLFAQENALDPVALDEQVTKILLKYDWPGNVRELRNFCENVTILHPGKTLKVSQLDSKFSISRAKNKIYSIKDNTAELLQKALDAAKGNKSQAAKLMGISRRTLHRRLHS